MRSGFSRSALLGGVAVIVASATAQAADMPSGIDYASPAMTSPTPASAWDVWGDASLALEFYNEPGFDEFDLEGAGRILFRFSNGFNIQVGSFAGHDFTNDVTFGNVNTDIFYATPDYAAGVYAGLFSNTNGFKDFFIGGEVARFFSTVDVGAWAGWQTGHDNGEAGGWLIAYLTPNTGLGGALFWEGNGDYDRYSLGWLAEHRLTDSQWSLWTDGNVSHFTGFGDDFNSVDARLGATYFVDPPGTTLQQHNHAMPF